MKVQGWAIASLPVVYCSTELSDKVPSSMRPVEAKVHLREDAPGLSSGQTTWVCEHNGALMALGWEWVEFRRGVVILADPMAILSNMQFLTYNGVVCPESQKVIALNGIVHALPWQAHVSAVLDAARNSRTSSSIEMTVDQDAGFCRTAKAA